ncbi:hypothetical protein [Piscinibacter gummiphilus]|uniref:Uncharacterized protein n=1 Tax=Piscinibacter gummiphilus TaxID=946333 RepID=A0A1W6L883_9BURK|nr:hypothetical protein [Piscinibacter gummiphilus]ARN20551.1 hypothetical protein A4W93_11960 [Piscinibacter gummiphilus]ATU65227.1 hypothetical protein CPZ87_12035 [Piscinibacter gummiphilus]GLS98369.1 hypothetical protein GCM10007918_56610 [Piscinibacter gummiphilus]
MTAPSPCSDPAAPPLPPEALVPSPSAEAPARPRPAPPSARAPAKAFRRGVVTVACELRTPRVVQFYRRDFTPISHWLDALDRARDFRHVDPRAAHEAERVVSAHLAAAQDVFEGAVQRSDGLIAAQGLADVPIRYADPVTVAAPIVHPAARTYLRVLSTADDAFASLERAWLLGLVDTRARRIEEARFRKVLRGISTRVREQYSAMARVLREARAGTAPPAQPGGEAASPGDMPWWQDTAQAENSATP